MATQCQNTDICWTEQCFDNSIKIFCSVLNKTAILLIFAQYTFRVFVDNIQGKYYGIYIIIILEIPRARGLRQEQNSNFIFLKYCRIFRIVLKYLCQESKYFVFVFLKYLSIGASISLYIFVHKQFFSDCRFYKLNFLCLYFVLYFI